MSDELDPRLARWFAAAEQGLTDAEFSARIAAARRRRLAFSTPWRVGAIVWHGLGTAVLPPLRMRPALTGLVATVALAIALGLALQ
jgi:hypothetical protein